MALPRIRSQDRSKFNNPNINNTTMSPNPSYSRENDSLTSTSRPADQEAVISYPPPPTSNNPFFKPQVRTISASSSSLTSQHSSIPPYINMVTPTSNPNWPPPPTQPSTTAYVHPSVDQAPYHNAPVQSGKSWSKGNYPDPPLIDGATLDEYANPSLCKRLTCKCNTPKPIRVFKPQKTPDIWVGVCSGMRDTPDNCKIWYKQEELQAALEGTHVLGTPFKPNPFNNKFKIPNVDTRDLFYYDCLDPLIEPGNKEKRVNASVVQRAPTEKEKALCSFMKHVGARHIRFPAAYLRETQHYHVTGEFDMNRLRKIPAAAPSVDQPRIPDHRTLRICIAPHWYEQTCAYVPLHGLRPRDYGWLHGDADWVVWTRSTPEHIDYDLQTVAESWIWLPRIEFRNYVLSKVKRAENEGKPLTMYKMFFESQTRNAKLLNIEPINPTILPDADQHVQFEWDELMALASRFVCPLIHRYHIIQSDNQEASLTTPTTTTNSSN